LTARLCDYEWFVLWLVILSRKTAFHGQFRQCKPSESTRSSSLIMFYNVLPIIGICYVTLGLMELNFVSGLKEVSFFQNFVGFWFMGLQGLQSKGNLQFTPAMTRNLDAADDL
jgi:hypothetical protein